MPDGSDGVAAARRAPFADSPNLGPRGQRTRQRIIDASLRVFATDGYHDCSIDRITTSAGCSRVSFYQYFSDKEDLFRHLAGQLARQLSASIEALTLVGPGPDGWEALRAWVRRSADIHSRYVAVFHAFPSAAESDEVVAGGSVRVGHHHVEQFRSSLATTDLPPRRLDPVIRLLMETLPLTYDAAHALGAVAPEAFPLERLQDAFTDVAHRTLFGRDDTVNVHDADVAEPTQLTFGPVMRDALAQVETPPVLTEARQRTRDALLRAGREVFVQRGYHGTRVDDVAAAAGMSHGTFYRYFDSTDQLADLLVADAITRLSTAFSSLPSATGDVDGATKAWLRRYNAAHVEEAALLRMWVDAALQDPTTRSDSAAAIDAGRRVMAGYLQPRGFGVVGLDAVVMVAVVGAFGAVPRDAQALDAAAYVIERGLEGR